MIPKSRKIRKQIMIDPGLNKNLEELSEETGYSQSEIIDMALRKLDNKLCEDPSKKVSYMANKLNVSENELIKTVLKKIAKEN